MKKYFRNRFYLRGTTWLGLLNTLLAFLFNRVIVVALHEDGHKSFYKIAKGTDFPRKENK